MLWSGRGQWISEGLPTVAIGGGLQVPKRVRYEFTGERGQPDARLAFGLRDGRPECVEVQVMARPRGRGLRTADLRQVQLDELSTWAFEQFAMMRDDERGELLFNADSIAAAGKPLFAARTANRRSVPLEELQEVAQIYRVNLEGNPTQAVAEVGRYSQRTAIRRIQMARERGLLPPTTRGKKKG